MTAPTVVLGNDTVTVLIRSKGTPDRLGVAPLISSPTVVTGCSMQPVTTTEVISDTDLTVSMWVLYAPVNPIFQGLTVADAIQVTVNGSPVVFEDFGDPQLWTDASGNPHHYTIKLRKARG